MGALSLFRRHVTPLGVGVRQQQFVGDGLAGHRVGDYLGDLRDRLARPRTGVGAVMVADDEVGRAVQTVEQRA